VLVELSAQHALAINKLPTSQFSIHPLCTVVPLFVPLFVPFVFNINTRPRSGAMGSVLSRPSANGGGALSDKQRQRRSTFAAFVKALDGKLLTAPAEESECEATPSIRGVAYTALLTSFGVHLVRLFLRDVLRKQSWYAAVEHPGMFELCALGSVHAAALAA